MQYVTLLEMYMTIFAHNTFCSINEKERRKEMRKWMLRVEEVKNKENGENEIKQVETNAIPNRVLDH